MKKLGLAIICSMMLLAGCSGSLKGDANAGPNPGGGFYGAPNIDIGRINPERIPGPATARVAVSDDCSTYILGPPAPGSLP
jgi:hypothetical protein